MTAKCAPCPDAGWDFGSRLIVHEVTFDNPVRSPALKLAKCQELGIEMFVDDRDDVCRLLSKDGILAPRVTRRDDRTGDVDAERDACRTSRRPPCM